MSTERPRLLGMPWGKPLIGHTATVRWGTWGSISDRPVLATGGDDGTVWLWDPAAGAARGEPLTGHRGAVRWGAWGSISGQPVLATGGDDGTVRLWHENDASWKRVEGSRPRLGEPLTGHTGTVAWGSWGTLTPPGRQRSPMLATGGDDDTVRLWHGLEGKVAIGQDPGPDCVSLTDHPSPTLWGCVAPGSQMLATGGNDGTVTLWDLVKGTPGVSLTGHVGPVLWGAWGRRVDGKPLLATGGNDNTVRLWFEGAPLGDPVTGHTDAVLWGAWGRRDDDQPILATGGNDTLVQLWELGPGAGTLRGLTGHTGPVRWGAWGRLNPPGPAGTPILVLATGGDDGTVRLWDRAAGAPWGEPLTGHTATVRWGAWGSIDGRPVLATGGDDTTVQLWEVIEDRPVSWLPSYSSDITTATDQLDRKGEAKAVADLITARAAKPPLAVGLFGNWGEGKSHFLELLQQEVTAAAQPSNRLAHSAVRQVQFNAWHYAESDLWASLVAELFAQLAAPSDGDGDPRTEQRRQSRLAAELISERGLRQRLQVARTRRDELHHALQEPAGPWDTLTEEQQNELRMLAGDRPEEVYRQAARSTAALRESGRASWRLVRGVPLTTIAGLVGLFVVLAAMGVGLVWGLPALWRWVAALPGLAGLLAMGTLAYRFMKAARIRASNAWARAQQFAERQRERMQTAADVADAEVTALEQQLQNLTAAGQLAGLVAERATEASYRSRLGLMTQIREDFTHMATLMANAAHDRTYEEASPEHQGTPVSPPGRASRTAKTDEANDELPQIDRIILYIDDLDRCPPRRVVEMLEAIHLLLAVELFVVVVAVDPRWLLRAIAAHYSDLLDAPTPATGIDDMASSVDPDSEELWQSTPAQYLEKIFQVVLTLPPLDTAGYRRLLHTLVGSLPTPAPERSTSSVRATSTTTQSPATAATTATASGASADTARPAQASSGANRDDETPLQTQGAEWFGVTLPAAPVVERVDPLTLEPDEITLLDLLGPPLLVPTPRAVKRLANSYGLLTALRQDHRDADLSEQRGEVMCPITKELRNVTYWPYRAGMVLLATLVAYPALGPALFLHLHHTALAHPHQTWAQFRETLTPRQVLDRWQSLADPAMTPVQAQQWQALLSGLDDVMRAAADSDLPLPEPLAAWGQWVVPVGRLSFPAGRIVSTLDRQSPLTIRQTDDAT